VQTVTACVINFKSFQMEASLKSRILQRSFIEVNSSLTLEVDRLLFRPFIEGNLF